ncbi:MAG TPA: serine hydrolase domain-containing protein [Pseudonocardia sp.]
MTGLSRAGTARFSQTAARYVADGTLPGVVTGLARGDEVHVDVLGSMSIDGPPMRRDTIFRIASLTKPMCAVTLLLLVGEGLVALDEPVDRLLPELADRPVLRHIDGPLHDTVPAERPSTVRELLTFTYGFGGTLRMYAAAAKGKPWPIHTAMTSVPLYTLGVPELRKQPAPDEWMRLLGQLPLLGQPGTVWLYNTGAAVAGVLCARAAGMPLVDVMRTRLFEPLGMNTTSFWTAEVDRLPALYRPTDAGLELFDPPNGMWSGPPAFGDGSAGLVSTIDDVLAFARMMARGGEPLLDRALWAEATRSHLPDHLVLPNVTQFLHGRRWGYGMSVIPDGPQAGAFGWFGGLGLSWLSEHSRDLSVVVLTQRLFEGAHATPVWHVELQDAAFAAVA